MSYPLINGAAINAEEGGLQLFGLDLVTAGMATAAELVTAGDHTPLELGDPTVMHAIGVGGIDLVSSGTHTGLFNALLQPPGMDLVTAGIGSAAITAFADGAQAFEFGDHRAQIGQDVEIIAEGIDLVREGYHSALAAQPGPIVVAEATSFFPLELGAPAIARSASEVQAQEAYPLSMGVPALAVTLAAQSYYPLEMGQANTAFAASVASARPLEYGEPVVAFALSPSGVDLVRVGTHGTDVAGAVVEMQGAHVLEIGTPGTPTFIAYARQSFPMQVGTPSISRGATC